MALILKTLKEGALSTTTPTVVYPPSGTTFPWAKNALVKNIIVQAVAASTVNIQITNGTDTWNVSPKDISMAAGDVYPLEHELTMDFNVNSPWKIQITLGAGVPSIKYVINGFEKDV